MKHLVALAGGWSLWRWACLRGTGFPAHRILELADAALAAAADQWITQDAEVARCRDRLIASCKAAAERAAPDDRRALQRALKRLWQHRVPDPIADSSAEAARRGLADAVAALAECASVLELQYVRAHRASSQALRRFAAEDRFRQALLWQNRSAVRTGVDSLLRQPLDASDSKTRQNERLVASYVQRYCVKNDTIGFFGPVGWARLTDDPGALVQRPGRALMARREVYYEHWAIDALALTLAEDPALRPFLMPRRLPRFRLDGTTLHYPIGRVAELSAALAAVASRCDGTHTARDIARALVADPALGLADEAAVLAVLDELAAAKMIQWTLEIPTAGAHPERHLAALLAGVASEPAAGRARGTLDALERARAVVAAASDAAQLSSALAAFDAVFTEATRTSSRRADGQTYAGRTPLYEDGRRDLEVELGRPLRDRLAAPLALLLHSARWYTHEIAARYRRELGAAYRRVRGAGDAVVDLARFWPEVAPLFPGAGASGSIVGQVRDELRRRWATVLASDPAERVVQRRAAGLADDVARTFAAPCPGWPAARHHSPDVMIAATGPAAIERGDYQIVIGELHSGFNTVAMPLFVRQHPSPDELIAARDADLDRVCIAPVWSKAIARPDYYSLSPRDLDLESGDTRSARPRDQVVAIGDLVVEDRAGQLEVRTRDGARRFDIIAFLEHHLIAESYAAFSPIAPAAWSPRITIDDVVISRASWRVTPAELAWPGLDEPGARFLAARRWAQRLGMPRWLFVKTPEEVKPVYVDLDSTVYVELLAKSLRGASSAALSEMLPTVEQTWVRDAAGAGYTAELRLAAVDPEAWRPDGQG